jgi:hypothetical protein
MPHAHNLPWSTLRCAAPPCDASLTYVRQWLVACRLRRLTAHSVPSVRFHEWTSIPGASLLCYTQERYVAL